MGQENRRQERAGNPAPDEDGDTPIVIAARDLRDDGSSFSAVREAARIRAAAAPPTLPPHPLIRRTVAALRKATPAHTGLVKSGANDGLIPCEVAKASLDRLEHVLAAMVAAAAHPRVRAQR